MSYTKLIAEAQLIGNTPVKEREYKSTEKFDVTIDSKSTDSGTEEHFKISIVFMNNLFSFRWTNSSGRRNLPRLKDEVAAELQTKFKNKSTFLTSGISEARNGGHEGMKDITTLEIVLKAFKSVGIKIK